MDKKSILIFGVGPLQKSIIERSKLKGLYTVGIDPMENAVCKDEVDAFEVVDGQDFEKTLEVAKRYNVKGIITAATDKPLVIMSRVAEKLDLPFFSINTAECSTDKLLMKERFQDAGVLHAKGFLIYNTSQIKDISFDFPVIVKPRDNSGSRGVVYCSDIHELEKGINEALQFTQKDSVLVEEFIEGKEYSIEAIHYNGESHVIQFTEKIITDFPYNVELGHIQPADITLKMKNEIKSLISKIAQSLKFENCASHTEIKINQNGVYVIETSPRLGGDFISSTLVPLSSGVNMEDVLIDIAVGDRISSLYTESKISKFSGICYFELAQGTIVKIGELDFNDLIEEIKEWTFDLKVGDKVNQITSSLNRYGYAIFQAENRQQLLERMLQFKLYFKKQIFIS